MSNQDLQQSDEKFVVAAIIEQTLVDVFIKDELEMNSILKLPNSLKLYNLTPVLNITKQKLL